MGRLKYISPFLLLLLLLHVARDISMRCSATSSGICGRCLPTAECWPDDNTWDALNISVGGRLLLPRPSASPCHHSFTYNAEACADAKRNWHNAFWRSDQPGAMQAPNFESDGELACNLPSSDEYAYTACYQGSVPAYAIRVAVASDVQTAISFATQHNLRLSIKSTGHDFLGRSTAPASLNIWMHHLKRIAFHDDFIPEGCSPYAEKLPAVTAEAGVQWNELYEAADDRQRVVVGGMSGSVSTAGGYLQGGGHSPLSPLLGLAADNTLELQVVTANGSLVTANSCQNRELFWALRGGGGGTYGVVISATHRTYPALENLVAVRFIAIANTSASFQDLVIRFVELQASMSDAGFWAGYSYITLTSIAASYLLPNITSGMEPRQAVLTVFEPIITYANMHSNEVSLGLNIQVFESFQAWRNFIFCGDANKTGCTDATGNSVVLASRLLPKDLLQGNATAVTTAFMRILGKGVDVIIGHLVGGRAVSNADQDNAVNPAWRTAIWHVVLASSWASGDPCAAEKPRLVTSANGLLRELTPDSGCYMNEADINEPDWKTSFYGINFERLIAIKKQVDPEGLFYCWKCVGSESTR